MPVLTITLRTLTNVWITSLTSDTVHVHRNKFHTLIWDVKFSKQLPQKILAHYKYESLMAPVAVPEPEAAVAAAADVPTNLQPEPVTRANNKLSGENAVNLGCRENASLLVDVAAVEHVPMILQPEPVIHANNKHSGENAENLGCKENASHLAENVTAQ